MANETELSNISHPTDVISMGVSDALVQGVVVLPHIYMEDLPENTNVKLFRKNGYLSGEQVSESAIQVIDGSEQELSMTEVTATAVKHAATCFVSVEAEQFSPVTGDQIASALGGALARDFDDEVKALFDDFSNQVTCTAGATAEKIQEAIYTVRRYTAGVSKAPLKGFLNYKAMFQLIKDISTSGAAAYSNESQISLLSGVTGENGFRGSLPGVDLYEVSGVPTSGGDDVGCIFDPNLAFAGMASTAPYVKENFIGATGDGTRAYGTLYSAWIFADVVEWNDYAGCGFLSDT